MIPLQQPRAKHRWPWPPKTLIRPFFLHFVVLESHPRSLFNFSISPDNFVTKTIALNFCTWNVQSQLIGSSWPITDWCSVQWPLKIQFEEALLSNPEGRDKLSAHSFLSMYFGKLYRLIIWWICFLLSRNSLEDNNVSDHTERRNTLSLPSASTPTHLSHF